MTKPFRFRFRVRYAELDPQAVVFNSRYLEYADLVITEYWRHAGLRMSGEGALEFHVARAEIDFIKPIRADETIEGRAWTTRIGRTSIATRIELHGERDGEAKGDLRASIELVNVNVDLDTGLPVPVPDEARSALLARDGADNGSGDSLGDGTGGGSGDTGEES